MTAKLKTLSTATAIGFATLSQISAAKFDAIDRARLFGYRGDINAHALSRFDNGGGQRRYNFLHILRGELSRGHIGQLSRHGSFKALFYEQVIYTACDGFAQPYGERSRHSDHDKSYNRADKPVFDADENAQRKHCNY